MNNSGMWTLVATVAAAMLSAALIRIIRPLLLRHALARPNARSSHQLPTPQGAGIAVVAATLAVAGTIIALMDASAAQFPMAVFAATLFIAVVGCADDLRSLPVVTRLVLQASAVAAILLAAPADLRVVPAVPFVPAVPLLPAEPVRMPDDPPQFEKKTANESDPPAATSTDNLRRPAHVLRMLVRPFVSSSLLVVLRSCRIRGF